MLKTNVRGGQLAIATTLQAAGDERVPVSFGYHPYLRLPDTPRRAWWVTLAAFRRLFLDERMIPTGERQPAIRRNFCLAGEDLDDALDALTVPAEFKACAGDRAVSVDFVEGFPYAQVFAPDGGEFACFEPMTVPTNALNSGDGRRLVDPGERYRTRFTISISGRCA
jgi:aldose 1-epimerase